MSDFSKLKVKKNSKEYILNVCTQDTEQNIIGTKNFSKLTVNSKNVVSSVNGVDADTQGNVTISTSTTPDYSAGVTKPVNVENTAEYDGWLLAKSSADDCGLNVTVNNVFTYSTSMWSNVTDGSVLSIFIPLAKGDVYKVTGSGLHGNYSLSCMFFKMR